MTDPKETGRPQVKTREPKKKTPGIFDNLRPLPQPHPVEEILGLASSLGNQPSHEERATRTPPTPPTPPTSHTAGTSRTPATAIAPARDYTKVANSIVRDAVAGGLFIGKSKQLYDFLYYRTRGAVVPVRSLRITKPKLMAGSGIGSERTLLKNLNHLKSIGLVSIQLTDGEHGGNEYTVYLPEEVNLPAEPAPPTPPTPPTPSDGRHALQERGGVPPVESGVRGVGSTQVDATTSSKPQTFSLRPTLRNDDDDAALAGLVETFRRVSKEITGRELSVSERGRWRELAEVLVAELKIASGRTTISSVPAFLTEHLRRRLWKVDKRQARAEGIELPDEAMKTAPTPDASKCPDCSGSGWWYPDGLEKGVKKCRHEKLTDRTGSGA